MCPVGVGIAWNRLSRLVLLGLHCTDEGQQPETSIWMSAVCPNGRENGERGKMAWDVCKEGEERKGEGHLMPLCLCMA